jgi:Domain of unknown function (DUF5615)
MQFILDENVPIAVAETLIRHGHVAKFIRDYVPPGSPDPLVATVAQKISAVLISFDGDFQNIAPRISTRPAQSVSHIEPNMDAVPALNADGRMAALPIRSQVATGHQHSSVSPLLGEVELRLDKCDEPAAAHRLERALSPAQP